MVKGHFQYTEDDPEGLETLSAISDADAFNGWMFDQVKPWLQSPVLEIGSGIGNLSKCCLEAGFTTTLSDVRPLYCQQLTDRFKGHEKLQEILLLDLVDPDFSNKHLHQISKFKSVFALNVIEHIQDDLTALKNIYKLLDTGGNVAILVPAGQYLYNKLDSNLQHYKRYSVSSLQRLMLDAGFEVQKTWHFNALGIPAWVYGGLTSKAGVIGHGQMNLYNKLVPIAKVIDGLVFNKIGLSVICVGRKI
jgi:SAM-dependent methyltransferase